MKIKTPLVIDLSVWEKVEDFSKIDPQPSVVIAKASEANFADTSFADFWSRTNGKYARMAYHFFRKDIQKYPIKSQIDVFLKTVKTAGLNSKDVLILDVEEDKTPAQYLVDWISGVEEQVPNEILIYSRKNILEPIVRTPAQIDFLKKYKIWVAGYPFTPDKFDTVPDFYVPNQSQWGKVVMWQYSKSAIIPGIKGEMDVSWIDPEYAEEILGTATPNFEMSVLRMLENISAQLNFIVDKMDDTPEPNPNPAPEPTPEPNPSPANDGYTGMDMGLYEVNLGDTQSIRLLDSYGADSTVLMDKTADWLAKNCPGWSDFVNRGFVTFDGSLWHIIGKVVNKQTIRVAEIAKGRARIIGFDADGDPKRGAVNLDALSPEKTRQYFHKIPGVNRYFPIVQPRQGTKKALQAWWIPVEYITKKGE